MRNDDNTTGKGVDSIGERINGGDIETVGRLVEQEHVGGLNGEEGEDDTGLLAIGKGTDERGLGLTRETVLAKLLAPVLVILGLIGVLVTDEVESGLGQVELLSGVLRVETKLQVGVTLDDTVGGRELAGHETEQGRLANTVGADESGTGVHVETEIDVAVKVVLGVTRVREGDVVEGQDGRRELLDIGEAEGEDSVLLDRLDEAIGLHLVENLLTGLGLADQVGVGTSASNELLDVGNFVLLLLVGLHLVGLLLGAGLMVSVVVTTIVEEGLEAHVDHVCADTVEEILGVRNQDEGTVPLLKVFFEPHAGLEIQMGGRVVEKEESGLDEEGLGEGDTHTPTTGHVLGLLLDGLLVETETGQNEGSAGLEGGGIHLVDVL